MSRKKYKHNEKKLIEACGIDSEKLVEKLKKISDIIDKMINETGGVNSSEVVELLERFFTKRELAFLVHSTVMAATSVLQYIVPFVMINKGSRNDDMYA